MKRPLRHTVKVSLAKNPRKGRLLSFLISYPVVFQLLLNDFPLPVGRILLEKVIDKDEDNV